MDDFASALKNRNWKTGIILAVGVVSVFVLVGVFTSSWTYGKQNITKVTVAKPQNEIGKDTLLSLAKQQRRLTVGKVHLKGSGWHFREKKQFMKKSSAVRGWTMPCEIDVIIDMDKLNEGSFDIKSEENGKHVLTVRLPTPEVDDRQIRTLQPDKLYLVLNDGEIESGEYRIFQQKAFAKIRDNIRKTIDQNFSEIIEMAKTSAAQAFCSFYASLGIARVIVEWNSDSLPRPSQETEASQVDVQNN